jgi:hypothetical protein
MVERSLTKPLEQNSSIFMWRDRYGVFHAVDQMQTRHLYFTLCVIWNHNIEPRHQLFNHRHYTFDDFYTKEYIAKAAVAIHKELTTRTDLEHQWIYNLIKMYKIIDQLKKGLICPVI